MERNMVIPVLISMIFLSSCDSGGESNATELEGTWVTTCLMESSGSFEDTITFSGNTFSTSGKEYADTACSVFDTNYSASGTFVIGNAMTTSSGLSAKEIDVTLLKIDGAGVSINVYDIYRIDGEKLYFGDDSLLDATSVANRPIDLDFNEDYIKQ